jgi:hypothetical protein
MQDVSTETKAADISLVEFYQPPIYWIRLYENHHLLEDAMKIFNSDKKVDQNHRLAGHLVHEYAGSQNMCNYFTAIFDQTYGKRLNDKYGKDTWNSKMMRCWVNYQQKYEFNPVHDHTGDYSFVYWVKIPYELEDEYNHPSSAKVEDKCSSNFAFIYTNIIGAVSNLLVPLTKEHEGCMVIFPSCLKHVVYPFYTSDDYRISISGNILVELPDGHRESYQ